jgi:hypothetical protein
VGQVVEMSRSKYSTNLLKYFIVTTGLLIALTCSASALDVVNELDGVLVVVNDGLPVPAHDGIVSADQLSSADSLVVSTIDFYVPFEAPSNTVVVRLSLLCSTANLNLSGDVQAGAFSGGTFYPHYTLSSSQWDYGYSSVDGVALTNTGYSVDTSTVPNSDFAWFVHFRLSGDAVLNLSQGSITGSTTGSIEGALRNGRGTFSSTEGSFGADLFATDISTPLWQYYDSYHTIYWKSAGARFAYLKSNSLSVSGDLTLAGGLNGVIRTSFERTSLADYPPIRLTATRTDDDAEAVAELQKVNATLDGMATNLQTITDDFTARENVGTDISGTTTEDQIANGNSGMSTGSGSISSAISSLPSFSSIIAPTSSFISFLTVPISQIFEFGGGYLLYIATVMVICCVIFWVIKRMGGDS